MKSEKHVIWSDTAFMNDHERKDLIDYTASMIAEEQPDASDDTIWSIAEEVNADFLDDERCNLDIQLGMPILVIGNLGLWDGRRSGYSLIRSGNIADCLYSSMNGASYCEWYLDELGDLRGTEIHHDGTNEYLYRVWKSDTTESQRTALLNKLFFGTATRKDITRCTRRLGDRIAEVYGWSIRGMKKGA